MQVYWSDSGELVCICSEDSYYVLQFNAEAAHHALTSNEGVDDDGAEVAFEVSLPSKRKACH